MAEKGEHDSHGIATTICFPSRPANLDSSLLHCSAPDYRLNSQNKLATFVYCKLATASQAALVSNNPEILVPEVGIEPTILSCVKADGPPGRVSGKISFIQNLLDHQP
jgi:hypothetical protein